MFRIAIASVVLASVSAGRITINEVESDVVKSKSKFGASCEELREMFHNRVAALQTFVDERQEGMGTEARLLMRSYGVIRTMRRARECSWVIDGDSDELDQVHSLVQTFLADNPCAPAARAELDAGSSTATEEIALRSVMRATAILNSEDCQVSDADEEAMNGDPMEEEEMSVQVEELDAQVQDHIDGLVDEGSGGGAFFQMDSDEHDQWTWRRRWRIFSRGLGVALVFLFLALACVGAAVAIAFILGAAISVPFVFHGSQGGMSVAVMGLFSAMATAPLGVARCSYRYVNQLVPNATRADYVDAAVAVVGTAAVLSVR